jgi:hypothetical protein
VGWNAENYGAEPDTDVDIAPHGYRLAKDTQLDCSIGELLKLETRPPFRPSIMVRLVLEVQPPTYARFETYSFRPGADEEDSCVAD